MNYLFMNQKCTRIFGCMLLMLLFLCGGGWSASAQQLDNDEPITLKMRNAPISDVLETITKRYQYAFIMRTANVDTTTRISIDVVDEPLRKVLDKIFAGQNVGFEIEGKLVRISKVQPGRGYRA